MKTARIFQESTGQYHICDDSLDYLDARGRGFDAKADAMRTAFSMGFTHAVGSGTYWDGVRAIPQKYRM